MDQTPDDESAVARGIAWYSVALTISSEMVVPGVIGIGLDRYFGTQNWCALVGFLLGIVVSMWHLLRLSIEGTKGMPGRHDDDLPTKRPTKPPPQGGETFDR
ncbi:MAG: AtpZ/AtpI family protein [Pirellulales bacterium]|nr:AtpZ/AtpI family protein [Pirellulales bacterium]